MSGYSYGADWCGSAWVKYWRFSRTEDGYGVTSGSVLFIQHELQNSPSAWKMSTSGWPHLSQVGAFQTNGIFTHLLEESSIFYNRFCDIYMLGFNVFD